MPLYLSPPNNPRRRMPMAPLLLPSLLLSLLLLVFSCHCIVDPTSTTLAIIQATGTVCGITAGTQNRSIMCAKFRQADESMASFLIGGTSSFDSISGGPNFLCSLRFDNSSIFCWDGVRKQVGSIYRGPTALRQISVGSQHVAAIDKDRREIRWWSYGCSRRDLSRHHFPKIVSGEYHSLTSGDDFTCAINGFHNVHCWGPHGKSIQMRFFGTNMSSLIAGRGHMCGLNKTGHIICTKNQPTVQSSVDFEFSSLAVGSNHTCAIKRENGTVVCWGRHGSYFPMGSTRFEFLVSGDKLTCGLTSDALNVSCWGSHKRNSAAVILALPKILPSVCVPDAVSCSCGVYPNSWDMCGRSGVICKKSNTRTVESCQMIQQPLAQTKRMREKLLPKWGWIYAFCFAVVGTFCILGVLLVLAGSHIIRCFRCVRNQNVVEAAPNEADMPAPPVLPDMENVEVFDFDVLRRATNNFSTIKGSILGTGLDAELFRGWLPDMRIVGVKRFNMREASAADAFMTELEILHSINHENIIGLIGYCTQNNERILVLEHMERNSLYDQLHPRWNDWKSRLFRSWRMRVKILLDVARGLQHLQQNAEPRIIHRELKSNIILIDENWVAKISDFRIALFGPEPGNEYVQVAQAVGANGYIDPAYQFDHRKAYPQYDVYSFGIIIMEVLTGRPAVAKNGLTLCEQVSHDLEFGRFNDVRDKRLKAPVGGQVNALQRVVQLAVDCVAFVTFRTNINNVVNQLEIALGECDQAAPAAQAPE